MRIGVIHIHYGFHHPLELSFCQTPNLVESQRVDFVSGLSKQQQWQPNWKYTLQLSIVNFSIFILDPPSLTHQPSTSIIYPLPLVEFDIEEARLVHCHFPFSNLSTKSNISFVGLYVDNFTAIKFCKTCYCLGSFYMT
jgi:hypothetical protein